MQTQKPDRVIRGEVIVEASVDEVWDAWTTTEGITSFFAPACSVELRVDGPYEILFDPDAEPGHRGAEGMRVSSFQPKKMLAFTWNAPPHLPDVREHLAHVLTRLQELGERQTRVTLTHSGWGYGGQWDEASEYFVRAWKEVVLPRLAYRFSVGAIVWSNPPKFTG